MSHLVCAVHERRVHVLTDGSVVHRNNRNVERNCFGRTVEINNKAYYAYAVATKGVSGAPSVDIDSRASRKPIIEPDFVERLVKSAAEVGKALSKFGEKLREGNTASKLLNDIFAKPKDDGPRGILTSEDVAAMREVDDKAYRDHAKLLSNYDKTPEDDGGKRWLHTDED